MHAQIKSKSACAVYAGDMIYTRQEWLIKVESVKTTAATVTIKGVNGYGEEMTMRCKRYELVDYPAAT